MKLGESIKNKLFFCFILFIFLFLLLNSKNENKIIREEPIHNPVVDVLKNVWIMEVYEDKVKVYDEGREKEFYISKNFRNASKILRREQIGDLELTDGMLSDAVIKQNKITGKLNSVSEHYVEIEGYGKVELAETVKCYQIFGVLTQKDIWDLRIGYSLQDFVVDDGKICACLITSNEKIEQIRVLLKNNNYNGIYHDEIVLTSDANFMVSHGKENRKEGFDAFETLTIKKDSELFIDNRLVIKPCVNTGKVILQSLKRNQNAPAYRGCIEVLNTPEGLIVINEVLLEEYLYSVVPSEMPASFPLEALKAQAICARTYAYRFMLHAGYPTFGAHVDDSTTYQVYNNIMEQELTTTAVKETYGELLFFEDQLAETYYYSTSCGLSNDERAWKGNEEDNYPYLNPKLICPDGEKIWFQTEDDFWDFMLEGEPHCFEKNHPWFRWSYQVKSVDDKEILDALQERYKVNNNYILTKQKDGSFLQKEVKKLGKIIDIKIEKRLESGCVDEVLIVGEENTFKVISEYNVRYILKNGNAKVIKNDNTSVSIGSLLPSAFFILETSKEGDYVVGYTLVGGGYGHGVGMSQNAAKYMAEEGYLCQDILLFFYEGTKIKNAYEG